MDKGEPKTPMSGRSAGDERLDEGGHDDNPGDEKDRRPFEVFISHAKRDEALAWYALDNLSTAVDDRHDGTGFKYATTAVAMLAASAGLAAAVASIGEALVGSVVGIFGVAVSVAPLVERLAERRRRKKYTKLSDIEDPVVRSLIEVASVEQERWAKEIESDFEPVRKS